MTHLCRFGKVHSLANQADTGTSWLNHYQKSRTGFGSIIVCAMGTGTVSTENSGLDWVLKQRVQEVGTMFRTVWDIYIKFYTVFLTFSLAAMSWLIEHKINSSHSHKVIAVVFIGQSLLTSITSGAIGFYSFKAGKQLSGTEITLLTGIHVPPVLKRTQTIPSGLGLWSGFANAAAMIGMACVWYWVGFIT